LSITRQGNLGGGRGSASPFLHILRN